MMLLNRNPKHTPAETCVEESNNLICPQWPRLSDLLAQLVGDFYLLGLEHGVCALVLQDDKVPRNQLRILSKCLRI